MKSGASNKQGDWRRPSPILLSLKHNDTPDDYTKAGGAWCRRMTGTACSIARKSRSASESPSDFSKCPRCAGPGRGLSGWGARSATGFRISRPGLKPTRRQRRRTSGRIPVGQMVGGARCNAGLAFASSIKKLVFHIDVLP